MDKPKARRKVLRKWKGCEIWPNGHCTFRPYRMIAVLRWGKYHWETELEVKVDGKWCPLQDYEEFALDALQQLANHLRLEAGYSLVDIREALKQWPRLA